MRQHPAALPVVTVACYALGYPLGALTVGHLSPILLILLRFVVSALLLWPIVVVRRTPVPRGRALVDCVLAGLLVQGMQFLGLYWGLAHGVAAGVAALVIAMNPVATAVLGRAVFGHRETAAGLVALGCGVAGVLLACLPRVLANPGIGVGLVSTVLALGGLAAGSLLQARRCGDVDGMAFTAIGVTVSVPVAGVLTLTTPQEITDPLPALGLLVLLAADGALATTCYAGCVRRWGARSAAVLFAVIPAVAAVLSWPLLGDPLGATTVVALGLGAVACVIQSRAQDSRAGTQDSRAGTQDSRAGTQDSHGR